jgi:hypothetical protein
MVGYYITALISVNLQIGEKTADARGESLHQQENVLICEQI